jgi:hypothetical protein
LWRKRATSAEHREDPAIRIGLALRAAETLRIIASNPELHQLAVAADLMTAPVSVAIDADLRSAAQLIVGMLDEHDISAVALERADPNGDEPS